MCKSEESAGAVNSLAERMSKAGELRLEEPVVAFMEHAEELSGYQFVELPVKLHHRYYFENDLIDCSIYADLYSYARDIVALSDLALRPHPICFHSHETADAMWIDEAQRFLEMMASQRYPDVLFRQPEYAARHKIISIDM